MQPQPQIQLDVQAVLQELEGTFASELAAKTREIVLERTARKQFEAENARLREQVLGLQRELESVRRLLPDPTPAEPPAPEMRGAEP